MTDSEIGIEINGRRFVFPVSGPLAQVLECEEDDAACYAAARIIMQRTAPPEADGRPHFVRDADRDGCWFCSRCEKVARRADETPSDSRCLGTATIPEIKGFRERWVRGVVSLPSKEAVS